MAEVTWFKVLTDMFSDDKIKIIQSMPEGDSLIVMWFKVLAQAGKTNDGGYIYLKKEIPYTPGMLSTLFNKPQQIVEMALRTFSEFGMIDIDERGYIFVTNWEKHQSIDKLNQIREKNRLRVQNHREKKKRELLGGNVPVTLQSPQSNDIDIEEDIDIEKDNISTTSTTEENPFKIFESGGFGTINSILAERIGDLIDSFGNQWVCEAMKEAVFYSKRSLPYVTQILERWKTSGIDEPWKEETNAKLKRFPQGVRYGANQRTGTEGESEYAFLGKPGRS